MSDSTIVPFHLSIPAAQLDDLRTRLGSTRWPDPETVPDASQGVPTLELRALCERWRNGYDWRRCEAQLNEWGLHRTVVDGVEIAFLHVRSPQPDALPMIMTHGWPGSIMEFAKVIGPLTDPVRYGDQARDAFHLVVPCLPGFGFSGKPRIPGWGFQRIADAWITLMGRLGYSHWVAQGGDLGSGVTEAIGRKRPPGCRGLHLNMCFVQPTQAEIAQADDAERTYLARAQHYFNDMAAYAIQQGTRPQTLGYLLADSAVGQAAWIYEKFLEAADPRRVERSAGFYDDILDHVMLYWLPNTGTSAARIYWELRRESPPAPGPIDLPTGYSGFPHEVIRASRRWLEARFSRLIHYRELDQGGHFAAFEQPQLFTDEMRATFRGLRQPRSGVN